MVFAFDLMNKRRDSNRKICAFVFFMGSLLHFLSEGVLYEANHSCDIFFSFCYKYVRGNHNKGSSLFPGFRDIQGLYGV
jgi:hypothetical protein